MSALSKQIDPQVGEDVLASSRGITIRAVMLGTFISILVNLLPTYSAYIVHSSRMVFGHLPMATMVVFTLVALPLNLLLRVVKPAWVLHRGEMVVIFCMGWISASIPAANFMGLLIGAIAAPHYYATAENRWGEYLLEYLPRWAVPSNSGGQMTWFFEGKPPGAVIPWDAWLGPLLWWGSFLVALALVSVAIVAILRKQWVERERLPFPLAEGVLAITEEADRPGDYALFHNRLFWIGVSIPFLIICWNIAGYFWHLLPSIELFTQFHTVSLGRGFPSIRVKLNFFILGFAFFTNLDILFSLWFFYLIGVVQTGVFDRFGYTIGVSDIWGSSGGAALGWQAEGAFIAFTLTGLWMGREHLKHVWRKALYDDPNIDDSNELMSYRTALLSGVVGALFMFFWLWRAGMSPLVALVFLIALLLMTIGVSRIVSESGLMYARMPITPQSLTFYTIGIRNMESTSAAALGLSYSTFGLGNTFGATTLAHIARLGAELRLKTRSLFAVTIFALVLSLVVSAAFTLYLGYSHGAYNFNVYTFNAGNQVVFNNVVKKMQTPFDTSMDRMMFLGIGAAVASVCSFLRYRFLWWPLSPIGLTVFTTGVIQNQAFVIFLAWLIKFSLLKTGGISLYRRAHPLFLGLLLGYVVGIGLIFIVDTFFFMGQGHLVHRW
ncbi:MAG: hypothetical protein HN521_12145 [Candidatus Latescibacteria bacterium]|jgi:hypothetical protein|nr:hypothetical protein [Candidatus Latescibacterota bacterium]